MEPGQDYVTKERLLKGAKQIEEVETKIGVVRIRPLTEAEKAKVESLGMKGIVAKSKGGQMDGMEINMESLLTNDYEARAIILACGLSIDKDNRTQPKEIKESTMEPDVRDQLLKAIRDLSGMAEGTSVIVDTFRAESRRKAAGASGDLQSSEAGEDGGGADPTSD